MRRYLGISIIALALIGFAARAASADPNPDFLTRFTLDCGTSGSFSVGVNNHANATKPIFVLDDTAVFRISSLAIAEVNNGEPLIFIPGLFRSDVPQLIC